MIRQLISTKLFLAVALMASFCLSLVQPVMAQEQPQQLSRGARIYHVYNNYTDSSSAAMTIGLLNETSKSTGFEDDLKSGARNVLYEMYSQGVLYSDIPAEQFINAYFGAYDRVYGENSRELLSEVQDDALYMRQGPAIAIYKLTFFQKAIDIQALLLKGKHGSSDTYARIEDNYESIASIQDGMGKYSDAEATLRQAIAYLDNKPYDPLAWLLLQVSFVQEHAGKLNESLASAQSAFGAVDTKDLTDPNSLNGTGYNTEQQIAHIQELLGNYPEAQRMLEQSLNEASANVWVTDRAHRRLAEYFVRRKQYQEAIQTYEKLLAIYDKNNPAGQATEQLRKTIADLQKQIEQNSQIGGSLQ